MEDGRQLHYDATYLSRDIIIIGEEVSHQHLESNQKARQ